MQTSPANKTPKLCIQLFPNINAVLLQGCYRNCFQHMVLRDCGCGDPRFPVPDGTRPCHAFNPIERWHVTQIHTLLYDK